MRGSRTVVLASSFAVVLSLTACGDGDHSEPQSDGPSTIYNTSGTGSPDDPKAAGPFVLLGAAKGGTVTLLTDHGLDGTLDPSGASDPAAVSLLSGLVTRSLTQYRYDPGSRQMVLVPDLAVDLGETNDGYTKWRFTIRRGARFEDGSPVTAADVVRGVRRCRHGRAFATSPCLDVPFDSVKVYRRNAVQFTFHRPYPDLPYLAATPALGPVPRGTEPGYGAYARHPVATGPYKVARYRRGHTLVLVRNREWDKVTDPGRTRYPDRYVIRAGIPDRRIERLLLADRGSARTTLTLDTLDPEPFEASEQDAKRLVLGSTPCTTYLAPDNRTITDPRVRRALIWAYPYRAALRAAGLIPGVTAVPATNLVPPDVLGRTPLGVPHHGDFETSPRVARRMLTRAKAMRTALRFSYDDTRPGRQLRDALVRSFRASGFDPRPQPRSARPVDLRTSTRCGAWPSGKQWLEPTYRSPSTRIDEHRMSRIARMPLDQMGDAWNALDQDVLRRQQPVVPLWYGGVVMAHGSRIKGLVDDPVHGMPAWGQLWVSAAS